MRIFNLDIPALWYRDFFEKITSWQSKNIVFTPNPEILLHAKKDREFLDVLQQAHYLTSDGIGLYIAYQIQENNFGRTINFILLPYYFFNLFFRRKYLYNKFWERICGSDLTFDLLEFARRKKQPICIIDLYNPTDIGKVANQSIFEEKLHQAFPELQFYYFIYNPENKEEIISQIQALDCTMLFSTLWMKKQEISVIEIMEKVPSIRIGLGVGSSFDYITGFQKRAPKWMRKVGIEWFFRICTSPGKIRRIQRVFQAVIVFPFSVLFDKKV